MLIGDFILGLAGSAVLLGLAVTVRWRKLHRVFPFFFTYVLYALSTGILREIIPWSKFAYFAFYWITEVIYGILALLVLCEASYYIFALKYALYRWFRWLLPLAVLSLTAGGSLWGLFYHPLHEAVISQLSAGIYWFDITVHALEGIILLLVFALIVFFSVACQQYEFAVLAGFAISAAVTIIADLFALANGSAYEAFFRYGPPVAYLLATMIWLHAFLRPAKPNRRRRMGLEEMHNRILEYWAGLKQIKRVFGFRQIPTIPPF